MNSIPLVEGRRLYGSDLAAYVSARQEYPESLYETLQRRCGLRSAFSVVEVGAGTGLATKRLLDFGVSHLRAIEPDPSFAVFLRSKFQGKSVEIDECSFEEAVLPDASFDLGIAATSFHWLDQPSALAKVYHVLKPDGWWAMWWMVYGAGDRSDGFFNTTASLLSALPKSPAAKTNVLDQDSRIKDLRTAGFRNAKVDTWRASRQYETAGLMEFYRTIAPVCALSPQSRNEFLDELASIAERQFGGRVDVPLLTILYTAQRSTAGAGAV